MKKRLRNAQMEYQVIDEVLQDTQILLEMAGEDHGDCRELVSPIMFKLSNPLAIFPCSAAMRGLVARSAAESLYFISGMNGSDFIWEFRGWEDPRIKFRHDKVSLGPRLRFLDQKTASVLDYPRSNALRQKGVGFTDQLAMAIDIFKKDKKAQNVIIQFASIHAPSIVHNVWFYVNRSKLEMLVFAGYIEQSTDLLCKIVSPFSLFQQIISETSEIPLGDSRFLIGRLYGAMQSEKKAVQKLSVFKTDMADFQYPKGGMCLSDIDTLISIMIEFVSRLDEKSLSRANPFDGDNRLQLWQDYANVFRVWKAEKLGVKIETPYFFHPQLRFIYGDGSVV